MIDFKKHLPDIIVVSISLLLCLVAFYNVILPMDVFGWDQSHHALYGQLIAGDIQNGNWDGFWYHTHRQTLWPFVQSWLLGLFFVFFGINYVTARTMHLTVFFVLLLSTWFIGKSLDKEKSLLIGAISWGLLIVSKHSWEIGLDAMIEVVAAAITIFAFYFFYKLVTTKKWTYLWPAGIFMAFLLVTKYNFALPVYLAVFLWALYEFINLLRRPLPALASKKAKPITRLDLLKPFFIQYALLGLPSIIMFFWWMFGPNGESKWAMIGFSKTAWVDKVDQVPGFINNFLYYFEQLITSYSWFPLVGALSVIGMVGIVFLINKRNPAVIILTLLIWSFMPLIIWVFMNKAPRYIYPLVPIIYFATAFFWLAVWDMIKTKLGQQKVKVVGLVFMAILALSVLFQSGAMVGYFLGHENQIEPGAKYMDILDYFAQTIPSDAPIVTGSDCGEISPYVFSFHFRDRQVPIYNKYSLGQVKFQKGMYLVAFMKEPTPEKERDDQWYKFIRSNAANLQRVDSKYFSKLNIKTEIYLTK